MSGGFDGYDHEAPSPVRLPQLQTAISALGADTLGLIDTFRWDEVYSTADLQELFGYKHALCINLNDDRLRSTGHNNGLTLLTNHHIIEHDTISLGTRDALYARVRASDVTVDFYLVYLDDLDEGVRLQQVDALLGALSSTGHAVVMGDLNSLAPQDMAATAPRLAEFYGHNPEVQRKLEKVIAGMQRGEVLGRLYDAGFQDASSYQPTVPTSLFPAKVESPFLRLDYALYTPNLQVTHVDVPTAPLFQETSDHLPLVFELTSAGQR